MLPGNFLLAEHYPRRPLVWRAHNQTSQRGGGHFRLSNFFKTHRLPIHSEGVQSAVSMVLNRDLDQLFFRRTEISHVPPGLESEVLRVHRQAHDGEPVIRIARYKALRHLLHSECESCIAKTSGNCLICFPES